MATEIVGRYADERSNIDLIVKGTMQDRPTNLKEDLKMKTVYVCEKCGASYDNYDAAYKCEESHVNVYTCGEYGPEINRRSTWKNGDVLPRTCILPSVEKYTEDPDTGEWRYVTVFGLYELKRMLKESEVDQIENERDLRIEKEEADFRKWQEEYKRSKEAKAAAEAAAKAVDEAHDSNNDDDEKESA